MKKTATSSTPLGESQRIPDHVTGIRERYLEAIQAEATAKQDYRTASRPDLDAKPSIEHTSEDVLLNHVNALRQHGQYTKLGSLAHYADEFEKLLPTSPEKYKYDTSRDVATFVEADLKHQRQQAESLTLELEMAVVEAKIEASREKAALQDAQAGLDTAAISPMSRLQALNAVRAELTTWVEESLAACGMDEPRLDMEADIEEEGEQMSVKDVEEAYAQYIEARKSLVAATEGLAVPMPDLAEEAARTERRKVINEADAVTGAEYKLRNWQDTRSLAAFTSYAQNQLAAEGLGAAQILQTLADESHLLQSYPLLSQAGRFKDMASRLGQQRQVESGRVKSQVEAWAFAAEGAETASFGANDKDVRRGNDAIEGAREMLRDLTLLQNSAARASN